MDLQNIVQDDKFSWINAGARVVDSYNRVYDEEKQFSLLYHNRYCKSAQDITSINKLFQARITVFKQ